MTESPTPFLLTIEALDSDGTVLDTETVPVESSPFYGFEKGAHVLGGRITLRVSFDPPLVAITDD